jgi:hypothetical protein
LREVGNHPEREAACGQRLDLDQSDVDAQVAASQQPRDRAHVAWNDVGERRDPAIRSRAIESTERESARRARAQRVRRRQAEEQRRPGEIRTLRDESFRQASGSPGPCGQPITSCGRTWSAKCSWSSEMSGALLLTRP